MSSNQPDFDPLNPTPEESDQMLAGYLAAINGYITPPDEAFAFAHGYRVGRNDKAGVADDDQRELARRFHETQQAAGNIRADAEQRRHRLRGALSGPRGKFGL